MSDPNERPGSHAVTLAASSDPFVPTSMPSSARSLQRIDRYVGETLEGRYVVEQPLGEGGMGVVYRGRHKLIDKRVAIKILRADFAADQEMTERFLNEAKAASSIGNPHIVDISDYGRLADGAAFFVMEFLDGISLGRVMQQSGVIPVGRLIHVAKQIARGLAAAHSRGIVHRDLKPDNVMLVERGGDRDFAKVLDFGIAKVGGEAGRLTRAGSVFGTPHYMSPEQAAGVPVDARTDIYSLGVILYEMAAGKVPFDADNFMGILTQHMYKSPAPIRAIVPEPQEVPPGLEAIVLKCLSKKVELRYQTMEELIVDLERVEQGAVPGAVSEMMMRSGGFNVPADYFRNPQRMPGGPAMMPGTPHLARRKPVLAGVLIGIGLALIVVGGTVAYGWRANANQPIAQTADTSSPSTTSTPSPTSTSTTAASAATAAAAAKVPVSVVIDPLDGTIQIDGDKNDKPLATSRTFMLAKDERVTLRAEAKGHRTKVITIDANTPNGNVLVKLDPIGGRAAAPPAAPPKPTVASKPTAAPPATTPTTPATSAPAKPSGGACPMGLMRDPFDGTCH